MKRIGWLAALSLTAFTPFTPSLAAREVVIDLAEGIDREERVAELYYRIYKVSDR